MLIALQLRYIAKMRYNCAMVNRKNAISIRLRPAERQAIDAAAAARGVKVSAFIRAAIDAALADPPPAAAAGLCAGCANPLTIRRRAAGLTLCIQCQ